MRYPTGKLALASNILCVIVGIIVFTFLLCCKAPEGALVNLAYKWIGLERDFTKKTVNTKETSFRNIILGGPFSKIGFNCVNASELLQRDSLILVTESSLVPAAHLINLERMKGYSNHGDALWFFKIKDLIWAFSSDDLSCFIVSQAASSFLKLFHLFFIYSSINYF